MSVVKVGPDDFEELAEVWEASVRATHDFLSEADIRELRSLLPVRYLPAVELRCLRDAGRIVAFARQGADSVDVNEQNPQAVGFYLRMGFAVVGRSETDDADRPFPILHLRLEK